MTNPRLIYLFTRHWNQQNSPEEHSEFMTLLRENTDDEELKTLAGVLLAQSPEMEMDPETANNILSSILTPIQSKLFNVRRLIMRVAVAAAAIIVFGLSSYWLFYASRQGVTERARYKNDVAAGGNKATLTLGNGTQIILDSAHKGMLAKQGSANIIKTDSGRLAYDITKEKATEVVYNTLTTPRGGQYQLTLPDGSQVWLNAASSIRYPTVFTGPERTVEITGEAYFEVVHNDGQPFRVKASGLLIEDVGTSFDVDAYDDEPVLKTTLIEGLVKVNGSQLRPGQQAQLQGKEMRIADGADIEEAMAWKNGMFRFRGAGIESILRQASRWYDVDIQYLGRTDETFSGGISRGVNISQLLHILELTNKVSFEIDGKKIIVEPAKPK